jgi:tape measure domain-containing protein
MSFGGGLGPIASAFVEITANTQRAEAELLKLIAIMGRIDDAAKDAAKSIELQFRLAAASANRSLKGIDDDGAFRGLSDESKRAGSDIGSNVEGGSGRAKAALGFLATGVALVGTALAAGGAAAVGFGLKSAASLEQTQVSFKALLGSAEQADAFIREMQQFAATTPFEFAGLADNAKQLLATSSALKITRDAIIPTISTIGDLTAVLGAPPEAIDRVITAFAQMASKGKVSTEELQQIGEALPGFPVFEAMAKGLNLTTAELQKQVSDGLIPADVGVQALLKGMKEFPGAAGAMAAQAQTLNGLFSTFKDTIQLTLTDAFGPLVEVVKTSLGPLTEIIGTSLGQLAPVISNVAGTLFNAIGPIIQGLTPGIVAIVNGIGQAFAILAPGIQAFGAILGQAFSGIAPLFAALGTAIAPLFGVLGQLVATVLPPLISVVTSVVVAFTPLIQIVATVTSAFLSGLQPVLQAFVPVFASLAVAFGTFFDILAQSGILTTITEIFQRLFPVIGKTIEILGTGLGQVLQILAPVLAQLADAVLAAMLARMLVMVEAFVPVLPQLAEAFVQIAIALAQLLVALLPLLIGLLNLNTLILTSIGVPVMTAIAVAVAFLATQFANFVTLLTSLLLPVLNAIMPMFQALWQNILVPFGLYIISGLTPIIQTLMSVFMTIWQTVLVPLFNFFMTTVMPIIQAVGIIILGILVVAVQAVIAIFMFWWNNVLTPLFNFFTSVILPIIQAVATVFIAVLVVAVQAVITVFMWWWNNVLTPLFNFFTGVVMPIIQAVATIFVAVLAVAVGVVVAIFMFWWNNVLSPVASFLSGVFSAALERVKTAFGFIADIVRAVLTPVIEALQTQFNVFMTVARAVAEILGNVLAPVIDFVKRGFENMKTVIGAVADFIGNLIGKIQTAVGFITSLADKINSLGVGGAIGAIKGLVGMSRGGVVREDMLAMLHSPEVVIPLNDRARAIELAERSGLLDLIAPTSSPGADQSGPRPIGSRAMAAAGVAIENVNVSFTSDTTPSQAREVAGAFTDSVMETLRRRQLALTVRTI